MQLVSVPGKTVSFRRTRQVHDSYSSAEPAAKVCFRDSRSCGCEAGPGEIALIIYRKVVFYVSDLHACGSKQFVHRCMSWASKGGKDREPFQI